MAETHNVKRTALLVRCTDEEAELIREAAKAERRTISGYILNCILHRIAVQDKVHKRVQEKFGKTSKPAVQKSKAHSSGT